MCDDRVKRNFAGEEAEIEELRQLSPTAKKFLNHHIRNVLTGVINNCVLGKHREAQQAALELLDILEMIAPLPCVEWKTARGL